MLTKEELQFIHGAIFNSQWNGAVWMQRVLPLLQKIEKLLEDKPKENSGGE